jgi:hypothetical protein
MCHAIAIERAVAPSDVDVVANNNVFQKTEMRVAMRGIDHGAGATGIRRIVEMPWSESQRLSARAVQHDRIGVEALHLDARDRPGIGPGPWLDVVAGLDGLYEGAFEQNLRQSGFGRHP